jgi:hypothetical protein
MRKSSLVLHLSVYLVHNIHVLMAIVCSFGFAQYQFPCLILISFSFLHSLLVLFFFSFYRSLILCTLHSIVDSGDFDFGTLFMLFKCLCWMFEVCTLYLFGMFEEKLQMHDVSLFIVRWTCCMKV